MKYINWADDKGIELELSLTYTYKSNRLIERVGQELILCLIKIYKSINLLEKLWLEAIYAAIYLYNHTLLNAYLKDNNKMTSLNKMLTS
jgi:hypothetical protein